MLRAASRSVRHTPLATAPPVQWTMNSCLTALTVHCLEERGRTIAIEGKIGSVARLSDDEEVHLAVCADLNGRWCGGGVEEGGVTITHIVDISPCEVFEPSIGVGGCARDLPGPAAAI